MVGRARLPPLPMHRCRPALSSVSDWATSPEPCESTDARRASAASRKHSASGVVSIWFTLFKTT
jgi:hypothetical protein